MEERVLDLYHLPDIKEYQDVCLLALRDECASMEQCVNDILYRLSDNDRTIIETYIEMRNELEFQTVKTALRWGKQHYK